jgi:hypothetical protein
VLRPRTYVLRHSQPSPSTSLGQALRAWSACEILPTTHVLGYFQLKLSKLTRKWPSGRGNLLNALKRTWASEIGLVLWLCFRPSTSTLALVEMDGQSCRELLEERAHSRSLGYARDDKFEGGGAPWHGWRWMESVEEELIGTRPEFQPFLRDSVLSVGFSHRH